MYNRQTCVGSKGISSSYILPVDGYCWGFKSAVVCLEQQQNVHGDLKREREEVFGGLRILNMW